MEVKQKNILTLAGGSYYTEISLANFNTTKHKFLQYNYTVVDFCFLF